MEYFARLAGPAPIGAKSAAQVLRFHKRNPDHSISSLWRFADSLSAKEAHAVKKVAEFSGQYAYADACNTRASLPEGIANLINIARHNTITERYIGSVRKEECFTSLSLMSIAKLPLAEIMEIRQLPAFRTIRKHLSDVRAGKLGASSELQRQLDACMISLDSFACLLVNQRSKTYDDIRRLAKNSKRTKITTYFIDAVPAVTAISETIAKGSYALTAFLTMSVPLVRLLTTTVSASGEAAVSAQTITGKDSNYEVLDGILENQ